MTKTRLTSKWALLAMVATIAVAFGAIMMATQIGAHNGIGPSNGIGIHICIGISESNDTEVLTAVPTKSRILEP